METRTISQQSQKKKNPAETPLLSGARSPTVSLTASSRAKPLAATQASPKRSTGQCEHGSSAQPGELLNAVRVGEYTNHLFPPNRFSLRCGVKPSAEGFVYRGAIAADFASVLQSDSQLNSIFTTVCRQSSVRVQNGRRSTASFSETVFV